MKSRLLLIVLFFTLLGCELWDTSNHYEKRSVIQNIIGLEIPEYEVIDSGITHQNSFDYESETKVIIEFKEKISPTFYHTLDSICDLPYQNEPDESSSFFYYSLESVKRCWTKKDSEYRYYRNTDFGKKLLHSTDAYFYFNIKKGSQRAEIVYGNY